jgi:hypothetical protein
MNKLFEQTTYPEIMWRNPPMLVRVHLMARRAWAEQVRNASRTSRQLGHQSLLGGMSSTDRHKASVLTGLVFVHLAETDVILILQVCASDHRQ